MCDQHYGSTTLFTNSFEQRDDLRLNRHVQRRGGLVRHNQFRLCRQRQRNHHTLTHATGKLMRVVLQTLLGRRNAGILQQGNSTGTGLLVRYRKVGLDGFNQLTSDGVQRIQRGQWILKNCPNFASTQVTHLLIGQVVDTLSFQQNLPASDLTRRVQETHNGGSSE